MRSQIARRLLRTLLCSEVEGARTLCDNHHMIESQRAVVLLSGGLDSATALAIAKSCNFRLFALSFNYGQRHEIELASAARVSKAADVDEHLIVDIDLRAIGG